MLDISKEIHSLSSFKRNIVALLEQMSGSGRPVIIAIKGKAEVVVQDAMSYQRLLDRLHELEALKSYPARTRRRRPIPTFRYT